MALSLYSFFDFDKKSTRVIYAAVSFFCSAAIIMGVLGIAAGTSPIILPGPKSGNTVIELLNECRSSEDTVHIIDPDSEVRGVWIASVNNINFPSAKGLDAAALKSEINAIIDTCVENNLNSIYFQVRPCSDALYKSDIFPTSEYLTGIQGDSLAGGFDPLEYIIRKSHENNIKLHAWVNPLRVTYGSKTLPSHNTSKLADDNPARIHPEYTVAYADGKLYYNAGLPEVRKLVSDGVREIAENYDVDGIVFDDYFYPYASYTNGVKDEFDDLREYQKYGGELSLADWRRSNINSLIEECYNTVKSVSEDCLFGVSPFGIWQNDDGTNGGSDTNGTSAYSELYCDASAWIEGGYIDYIAPQIYWSFTNNAARYDTLVRWWNALCDGTGVKLLVSHAAYRYADEWSEADNEILNQIEFARSEMSYRGSIFYGYDAIKKNSNSICDELRSAYSNEIIYTAPDSDGAGVLLISPEENSTLNLLDKTYLLGRSDPAYPLYYNGRKISRTKSGYYSLMVNLEKGKNEFVFTQNGKDYTFVIYNGTSKSSASSETAENYRIMDKFEIIPLVSAKERFVSSGEAVNVSVKAPAGSSVRCYLGENSVKLNPQGKAPGTNKLYEEIYSGKITMPEVSNGEIIDLGEFTVKASLGSETQTASLGDVRAGGEGSVIPIEVTEIRTGLKIAPDSYYYDDFTSQALGMRDNAVRLENGYYLLRVGGYVKADDVKEISGEVPISEVGAAEIKNDGEYTRIYIKTDVNFPMNGRVEDGYFILNLYNVGIQNAAAPVMSENPLFESAEYQLSTKKNCFRYHLKLKDADNFYGFEFSYKNGMAVVSFRNPSALADGEHPLSGKTIVLDAGHGGKDNGALGPSNEYTEAALNLEIVLAAKEKLEKLGAEIVLTRSDDSYVALTDRMLQAEALSPDLCISIHQNSMEYNVDITKIRGTMSMYWEYAGRSLAQTMADSFSSSLGRLNRGASAQRLAMVRCERYPSTLIEVGFMTNVEELERISSPEGINTAAEAIVNGILDYYRMQSKMLEK